LCKTRVPPVQLFSSFTSGSLLYRKILSPLVHMARNDLVDAFKLMRNRDEVQSSKSNEDFKFTAGRTRRMVSKYIHIFIYRYSCSSCRDAVKVSDNMMIILS
jgi:hypothetical protein